MNDFHNVWARLEDGTAVRIGPWCDWSTAIKRWYRLDNPRARGRRPYINGALVKFYAVRSEDDPAWSGPRVKLREVVYHHDQPHAITTRRNNACRRHKGWAAILTTDTGVALCRTGHSPFAAQSAVVQAARLGRVI